jgi:hypothetical protein
LFVLNICSPLSKSFKLLKASSNSFKLLQAPSSPYKPSQAPSSFYKLPEDPPTTSITLKMAPPYILLVGLAIGLIIVLAPPMAPRVFYQGEWRESVRDLVQWLKDAGTQFSPRQDFMLASKDSELIRYLGSASKICYDKFIDTMASLDKIATSTRNLQFYISLAVKIMEVAGAESDPAAAKLVLHVMAVSLAWFAGCFLFYVVRLLHFLFRKLMLLLWLSLGIVIAIGCVGIWRQVI